MKKLKHLLPGKRREKIGNTGDILVRGTDAVRDVERTEQTEQSTLRLRYLVSAVPDNVLDRIFRYICPHATDETYESCEDSTLDDACMLCDLRDVAHCGQVCRRWRRLALEVMYYSIRIDPVHYCKLEGLLAERRKRKSWANRNAEPEDTASARVRLLCRTLRESYIGLGTKVRFLKVSYMAREVCKADLARLVAVTPRLRYVDLPKGYFENDATCAALRAEIQGSCGDLRKMMYKQGMENRFEDLIHGFAFPHLEVLELVGINIDSLFIRRAIEALQCLQALRITDMLSFNDSVFTYDQRLAPFPSLTELVVENVPNLTHVGLQTYLSVPAIATALKFLSLTNTSVQITSLYPILLSAPSLTRLSIEQSISAPLDGKELPPLTSPTLQTLNFEISSSATTYPLNSYYDYLLRSILTHSLPALQRLYVRDPDFPEKLASETPAYHRAPIPEPVRSTRFSSNNPFGPAIPTSPPAHHPIQSLEIYSKSDDELRWNYSLHDPLNRNQSRSPPSLFPAYIPPTSTPSSHNLTPRPTSMYGLVDHTHRSWTQANGARRSVLVSTGDGFLAVPGDATPNAGRRWSAHGSSGLAKGETTGDKYGSWR